MSARLPTQSTSGSGVVVAGGGRVAVVPETRALPQDQIRLVFSVVWPAPRNPRPVLQRLPQAQ